MAILKQRVEALKDAIVVLRRASGQDLRNEITVGLVPIELGNMPEVGESVLGLSPKLGEARELVRISDISCVWSRERGITPTHILLSAKDRHPLKQRLPPWVGMERNEVLIGFRILAIGIAILDRMIERIERGGAVSCKSLRASQVVLYACTITILDERKCAQV